MRIVSLLPSATEIVADLGLAHALVGRSHECDTPAPVRALPVVSASRIDTGGLDGAAIDDAVGAAVAAGTPLYAIDAARLAALRPDLIITQDLCRVCAVSGDELCDVGVPVKSLAPRTLAGIADSVRTLGAALGVPGRAEAVVGRMQERIAAVRVRVAHLPPRRVFFAEWHDPPFAAGHWVPEQVAAAGGEDVLGRAGARSRRVTWAEVAAAGPDVVVMGPCGYGRSDAAREWDRLCRRGKVPGDLAARAVVVDANAHFSRPAPAVAGGIEELAAYLHGPPG